MLVADDASSHAAKFNDLSQLLKFFSPKSERQIKKFINAEILERGIFLRET